MKALILAGGFATRLWPLTMDKAKPLLPIADKAIISHLVDAIAPEVPIIVSTNAVFEKDFRAWRTIYPDRDITIFVEDAKDDAGKKGALRAVGLVIEEFHIQEDLLTIGGDNVFDFSIEAFIRRSEGKPTVAAYDVKDLELAKKYGVIVADGERIVDFQEKPLKPKSTLAGTACYYFPANTLTHIVNISREMPDNLGGIFASFLEAGMEPRVFSFDGYWNDIGSFRAYVEAHIHAGKEAVPDALKDPLLGNTFEGVNYIDPDCTVKSSHVKNSIILGGTIINDCRIENCIIDKDCEFHHLELHQEIVKQKTVLFNR